jgi:hypothetical protein
MKQLIRISFLFIVLFLTIPVFADGDMGAGGNSGTGNGKVAEPTVITKTLDSGNLQTDASESIFSWVFQQISEFIN